MVYTIKSFLGLALLCLVLSACENASDPNKDVPNSLTGRVVILNTDDSNKPFSNHSGVTVVIEGTSFSSTTDSSGNYTILDVPSGSYTITYAKPGFDSATRDLEYSGTGTHSIDTVQLHSLPTVINSIRGKIVLRELDTDIELADHSGVAVSLVETAFSTTTNKEGEYQLNNVPPGTYNIRFEKPGFYGGQGLLEYSGGIKQLRTIELLTYTAADITLDPITVMRASKLIGRDFVDSVVIDGDTSIYISGQALSSKQNLMIYSGKSNLIDHTSLTIRLRSSDGKTVTATSTKLVTIVSGKDYMVLTDATYVKAYLNGDLEGKPTVTYLEAYYKQFDIFSNEQPVPHF